MRSYPKYKPSGVDWLGEIPSEFNIISLKNLVKVKVTDGPHETPTAVEDGIPFISAEAIQNFSINFDSKWGYITKEDHLKYSKKCSPKNGDIFIVKSGATTGKVAYVDTNIEFNIWSPLALIRADEKIVYSRYLFYFIISQFFQEQIQFSWSFGTQQNIGMGVIQNLQIVISSLSEQQQIVDFLDYKTGQCDRFIANRQKQIELLNEQKAAIINKAVTKGINPNAKMKPSGIEWIGDIPEHWKVKRPASFGRFLKGSGISKSDLVENGVPVILYGDIYTKYNLIAEHIFNFISQELASNSKPIYKGDLLFTGSGETREDIGKCIVYNGETKAYAGGDLMIFRQKTNSSLFLAYSFSTNYAITKKAMNSRGDIIIHIYASALRDIYIPIPSLSEQQGIIDFIKKETSKIENLISKYQKQIELMQEYRTALISQAVTGKIDVREWKPPT